MIAKAMQWLMDPGPYPPNNLLECLETEMLENIGRIVNAVACMVFSEDFLGHPQTFQNVANILFPNPANILFQNIEIFVSKRSHLLPPLLRLDDVEDAGAVRRRGVGEEQQVDVVRQLRLMMR